MRNKRGGSRGILSWFNGKKPIHVALKSHAKPAVVKALIINAISPSYIQRMAQTRKIYKSKFELKREKLIEREKVKAENRAEVSSGDSMGGIEDQSQKYDSEETNYEIYKNDKNDKDDIDVNVTEAEIDNEKQKAAFQSSKESISLCGDGGRR